MRWLRRLLGGGVSTDRGSVGAGGDIVNSPITILHGASAPPDRHAPSPLRPAPSLVGRDKELEGLLTALLDDDPRPVLLHGGPGIGKTSLSLAALHASRVVARYGQRRYLAPLAEVQEGAGLLPLLGAVMGLAPGPDLPARTLAGLLEAPAMVVLDNLETPWELDGGATREALDHLRAVPGLRLLASIRGTERPGALDWRVLDEVPPPRPRAGADAVPARGR